MHKTNPYKNTYTRTNTLYAPYTYPQCRYVYFYDWEREGGVHRKGDRQMLIYIFFTFYVHTFTQQQKERNICLCGRFYFHFLLIPILGRNPCREPNMERTEKEGRQNRKTFGDNKDKGNSNIHWLSSMGCRARFSK